MSAVDAYLESDSAATNLVKAFAYACEKHKDQRRKADRTPYINHPARVADKLRQHRIHYGDVAVAAILHDVVEDTDATIAEIEELFGETVANIVAEVTDDKTLTRGECKRDQVERIGKASDAAKLIKICDKIDNCAGLFSNAPPKWSVARIQGYFWWADQVVDAASDAENATPLVEEFRNMVERKQFHLDGRRYPCLPHFSDDDDFDEYAEEYYSEICYEERIGKLVN